MNMEDDKVALPLAEIIGEMLLEMFSSEMMSLEWRKPRSRDDLEEVGNSIDFERVL